MKLLYFVLSVVFSGVVVNDLAALHFAAALVSILIVAVCLLRWRGYIVRIEVAPEEHKG